MEIAVVVGGHAHIQRDVGYGSSMDAEWLALIHAMRVAITLSNTDVVLIGDCAAVINQVNGVTNARGANITHLNNFLAMQTTASRPRIRYIKRAQNLAGIALARLHSR